MESLFHNRGPNITVKLRNNHNTYLAASNDEKSLTLVSPAIFGYTPKIADWIIKFHSATPLFTYFRLWSIYGKELAGQKEESGEVVFRQKQPYSSPLWRSDNSQPLSGGIYLFCDCETIDWVSDFYKLSATQDGAVLGKPSCDDTLLDPGSWWFIEVVEKITPKSGSISNQAPQTSSTSHRRPLRYQFTDTVQLHSMNSPYDQTSISTNYGWNAPTSANQFQVGFNTNGAGTQNVGNVEINSEPSVTDPVHGMTPNFRNSRPETRDEQPSYNPEHHPGSFATPSLGSSRPHSSLGSSSSQSHNLGNSARDTTSGITTYISAGNNSNGSGTQTNKVSIKNKTPIYKYW